jgi:elongation factor 1-beta
VCLALLRIYSHNPTQADVVCFKAIGKTPDATKYPHAARWYKHLASHETDFATLPGDASKAYSTYGPATSVATINPAKLPEKAAEEDDEDVDLFGSDDEEEDAEAVRIREERLAEYKKKKEGKTKPAAKSIVTMDVKPWGQSRIKLYEHC